MLLDTSALLSIYPSPFLPRVGAMESIEGEVLGRIVVYSIVGCPHCLKAKATIREQGLSYTEVSVDRQGQTRYLWICFIFPYIFINDFNSFE